MGFLILLTRRRRRERKKERARRHDLSSGVIFNALDQFIGDSGIRSFFFIFLSLFLSFLGGGGETIYSTRAELSIRSRGARTHVNAYFHRRQLLVCPKILNGFRRCNLDWRIVRVFFSSFFFLWSRFVRNVLYEGIAIDSTIKENYYRWTEMCVGCSKYFQYFSHMLLICTIFMQK